MTCMWLRPSTKLKHNDSLIKPRNLETHSLTYKEQTEKFLRDTIKIAMTIWTNVPSVFVSLSQTPYESVRFLDQGKGLLRTYILPNTVLSLSVTHDDDKTPPVDGLLSNEPTPKPQRWRAAKTLGILILNSDPPPKDNPLLLQRLLMLPTPLILLPLNQDTPTSLLPCRLLSPLYPLLFNFHFISPIPSVRGCSYELYLVQYVDPLPSHVLSYSPSSPYLSAIFGLILSLDVLWCS